MTETLICGQCCSEWTRTRTRGPKPTRCPSCKPQRHRRPAAPAACQRCGGPPAPGRRKWCDSCFRAHEGERSRQYREKITAEPKIFACEGCGSEFEGRGNQRLRFCSDECRPSKTVECIDCGDGFEARTRKSLRCASCRRLERIESARKAAAKYEAESGQKWHRRYDDTYKASHKRRRDRNRSRTDEEIVEDQRRLRPDGLKRCDVCRAALPLSAFSSNRSTDDGLRARCRRCDVEKQRAKLRNRAATLSAPACYICGSERVEHVEHVVPRRRGGDDEPVNLAFSCEPCNLSKNDSDPGPWLRDRMGSEAAWDFLAERVSSRVLIHGAPLTD